MEHIETMNTSELLEKLTQHGVELLVNDDKLSVRSPKGVLTPALHAEITAHKAEILCFLRREDIANSSSCIPLDQGLSLQTIGCLIGGFVNKSAKGYKQPIIDSKIMAQKLIVTFKPLTKGYKNVEVIKFREELEVKLREYKVKVEPWEKATVEVRYDFNIPVVNWKKTLNMRVVKAGVNAVIDVERPHSLNQKIGIFIAETLYKIYSQVIYRKRKISVSRIARLSCWAEDHAAKYIEDPTNTQVIVLTQLDKEFVDPTIPYQKKITIGLNTLIRTFSEMVIGVSREKISILNMNLSDSIFSRDRIDDFVLNSLVPKVFVPIMPLLMEQFEVGRFDPCQSIYAKSLVTLGKKLVETNLFPPGSKLSKVIKRKSHRDIVDVLVNGRTGISYGFVAYAEVPQYVGDIEIDEDEWQTLSPIEGFNSDEVRQNQIGRRYIKTKIGAENVFKQIPDIWLVSSRSGSNKTHLSLESDILRIGLTDKLLLQLPQGTDLAKDDIKPSYDIYVMLGIALSAALYAPELVANGAPIVHFHGYPASDWFRPNEYCVGTRNPSVPCGTYESGVFNFLGIASLANQQAGNIALASLLEPDHGTNVIAPNLEYLLERLKSGCEKGQIELGGRHFASLVQAIK